MFKVSISTEKISPVQINKDGRTLFLSAEEAIQIASNIYYMLEPLVDLVEPERKISAPEDFIPEIGEGGQLCLW